MVPTSGLCKCNTSQNAEKLEMVVLHNFQFYEVDVEKACKVYYNLTRMNPMML